MESTKPKYRFTPSLLSKWTEFVEAEAVYREVYTSDEPPIDLEEFEAKCERELWDAINRVPQPPSEAADRGTALNEIVDAIVERRGIKKEGMVVRTMLDADRKVIGAHVEYDGFTFEFSASLYRLLASYFAESECQYRCEATIDTCYGDVILYGDADYIRKDRVYDLKTTKGYKYGKYERGWQKDLYPYCLVESGDLESVSEFEYTVVQLTVRQNQPISGDLYRERYDYNHEGAKVRLRAVSEALAAYLEQNAERIVHPSRVLNEI